jgi:hypothetical protein
MKFEYTWSEQTPFEEKCQRHQTPSHTRDTAKWKGSQNQGITDDNIIEQEIIEKNV